MWSWREKPRVLIVDDDDDFASDLGVLLSSEFEVRTATGTKQAWKLLGAHQPDCLLLDMNMPEFFGDDRSREGLSFLNHLRHHPELRRLNQVPVIVLTAYADVQTEQKARMYGVSVWCRKPPDIKRLTAAIWSAISAPGRNLP
jgi:CheY-like chemotaxis protein